MQQAHMMKAYWEHFRRAGDRHHVHSPFVSELIAKVLRRPPDAAGFGAIERLRGRALRNGARIEVTDLGAGPRSGQGRERSIRSIARSATRSAHRARQLHGLAHHVGARYILELGTSLGFTTLYLAQAVPEGQVTTIEGCPAIRDHALRHFQAVAQRNITSLEGSFATQLPRALDRLERLDLAFVDGHHALEPTMHHFHLLMERAHEGTVLVMDDIHWSPGMEEAWRRIQADPRVKVTVDLFDLGLVFLHSGQVPEHFRLRY